MATVKTNTDVFEKAWEGFKGTDWKEKASVSRFVQANYTPYDGDESFLAGPTERSLKLTTKKLVSQWILVRHQSQIFLPAIFQKTTN